MRHAIWILCAVSLPAQSPLTLRDAVRMAVEKHPAVEAEAARSRAAETRITQARGGLQPKVNYTEQFARSDNPVFVFSSLLTQRQFGESNFQVGTLNRPDFLNNFQSLVTVDQTVYDWGATKSQIKAAELGRDVSRENERRTRMDLVARVVRSYYGAVLAQARLEVAREAMKSAEADLARAESVRKAGMSTDADVLSIRVHVASVRENEIRRGWDVKVATAALNEALGLPLETPQTLPVGLQPARVAAEAAGFEKTAEESRPELRQVELASRIAEQQKAAARSALLPMFGVRGQFEADRQRFVTRGGSNWLVAASMRWNLFDGHANRARVAEADASLAAARAQKRAATAGVKLEVFSAWSQVQSAGERIAVASAAVTQAEESLRIIKNRYEAGLATVTDLLRNETALLEARMRKLAAVHDQRLAAAQLEYAAGTLSADSEVLQ